MKHFYHYLLTVFLAGQVPGWGAERNGKETHLRERQYNRRSSGGVCKSGTAAGESVGRQVAVRHSEPGKKINRSITLFDVIGELPGIQKRWG